MWFQSDLEDQANELRSVEENSKKACADAARLAEELRQEQDHASHIEKMRRTLESQVKELQVCISDSDVLYHLMYENKESKLMVTSGRLRLKHVAVMGATLLM